MIGLPERVSPRIGGSRKPHRESSVGGARKRGKAKKKEYFEQKLKAGQGWRVEEESGGGDFCSPWFPFSAIVSFIHVPPQVCYPIPQRAAAKRRSIPRPGPKIWSAKVLRKEPPRPPPGAVSQKRRIRSPAGEVRDRRRNVAKRSVRRRRET